MPMPLKSINQSMVVINFRFCWIQKETEMYIFEIMREIEMKRSVAKPRSFYGT